MCVYSRGFYRIYLLLSIMMVVRIHVIRKLNLEQIHSFLVCIYSDSVFKPKEYRTILVNKAQSQKSPPTQLLLLFSKFLYPMTWKETKINYSFSSLCWCQRGNITRKHLDTHENFLFENKLTKLCYTAVQ